MGTAFAIYIYLALGQILSAVSIISTLGGVAYAVLFIMCTGASEGGENEYDPAACKCYARCKRALKPVLVTLSTLILLNALYPSKDDLEFIAGGTVVLNSEEVQKLPDNLIRAANSFLEQVSEDK